MNSIASRLARVLAWLQLRRPDVLCLQELKLEPARLPLAPFWALGYQVAFVSEKTWNGVAIVARHPISDVVVGGMGQGFDHEARLIAATVAGVRVLSVYVPHGQQVTNELYKYKLRFLAALRAYLDARAAADAPLLVCGDFNVCPEARDVFDPKLWANQVHYHADVRVEYRHLLAFGLHDTFRKHHPAPGLFTFWDYRAGGFERNHGLRIDHILATRPLAERCTAAGIDIPERMGPHASDHAPVVAVFND